MRLLVVLAAVLTAVAWPAAAVAAPTEMQYSVSAHPDDEAAALAYVMGRPQTYWVWVIMTRGEQTDSCLPASEVEPAGDPGPANATLLEGFGQGVPPAKGPYKFQGPGSPVGEPDRGERAPLGDPWQGRGTVDCQRARVASWHWVLDDMAGIDAALPSFEVAGAPWRDDSHQGRFCRKKLCADVWATGEGARVAFDLPDSGFEIESATPLTAARITDALQRLRRNRRKWGLPTLPERGVLANAYHYGGDDPVCANVAFYDHADHRAVQEAIYSTPQGAGPQVGPACVRDPRVEAHPGPIPVRDPAWAYQLNAIDPLTEQRQGPFVVNYGWLFPTYQFGGNPENAYWQRDFAARR